jgi:hypothetical protein
MAEKTEQPRSPGTEIVPRGPDRADSSVTSALLLATDLAIGAASQATRLALRVGATGWSASVSAGRLVSALPGAHGAGQLLNTATHPLVAGGRDIRARTRSAAKARTQRLLEAVVPELIDALDIDQLVLRIDIDQLVRRIEIDDLVQRIDIDALVQRIEIDQLVGRIDIDALVQRIDIDQLVSRIAIDDLVSRIDIDALVQRIAIDQLVGRIDIDTLVRRIAIDELVQRIEIEDLVGRIDIDQLVRRIEMDALMQRIDLDAVVARIDVNRIAERIDVDAVVEQTELGTIVARSTSGFASEALDAARSQTADVDTRVSRAVNRVLRRKEGEVPIGPPLLTGGTRAEDTASASGAEPLPPDAPDRESK